MNPTRPLFFSLLILFAFLTCTLTLEDNNEKKSYRQEMISFVSELSKKARKADPEFIVIAQNGQQLVTREGEASAPVNKKYLSAIDGIARENLFYGYPHDNQRTPDKVQQRQMHYLDLAQTNGSTILAVNYCWDPAKIAHSYKLAHSDGYISFAAPSRDLDEIPSYSPSLINQNEKDIHTLSEAENFLYLIDPDRFETKEKLIRKLAQTNYDILVIDFTFYRGMPFTPEQIERLKTKANSGGRLVIAYMSIGEAEDYRYYWKSDWEPNPPEWLEAENPDWEGNYPVKYWHDRWKDIIIRGKDSYLSRILELDFDGVFLDRIDAFQYFEQQQKSK